MQVIEIDGFLSFTLAIVLLFIGKFATMRFKTFCKSTVFQSPSLVGLFVHLSSPSFIQYLI